MCDLKFDLIEIGGFSNFFIPFVEVFFFFNSVLVLPVLNYYVVDVFSRVSRILSGCALMLDKKFFYV